MSLTRSQRVALRDFERERLSNRSAATRRTYLPCVREFLEASGCAPSRLKPRHVRAHLALASELSAASQKRVLCSLRSFCSYLVEAGTLSLDPTEGLRIRVPNVARIQLTKGQVCRLLRSASKARPGAWWRAMALRDRALLELLYSLALRSSEACAARISDLDLARGELLVRSAKAGDARRLPIPQHALTQVGAYLQQGRARFVREETGHLFLSSKGRPLVPGTVTRVLNQVSKRAGVKAHAHALRRACATHLVEEGVNLREVQLFLGHTSLKTTALYVGVSRRDLHRVVRALEVG